MRALSDRRRDDGNVAAGAISVLKSSIPYVASVENRRAARGGVDGEDIENAKVRGPIRLRTRGRAVTAEDYEYLAREAAPEVARVRALQPRTAPRLAPSACWSCRRSPTGGRLELDHLVASRRDAGRHQDASMTHE